MILVETAMPETSGAAGLLLQAASTKANRKMIENFCILQKNVERRKILERDDVEDDG